MPYSIEYIDRESGLIISWSGIAKGDELIRSYHERFSSKERLATLNYIITDYTNTEDINISSDQIKLIAQISNQASQTNSHLYGVAVMPTDIAYGMARMWQSYADDDITGWRTKVTRTRAEAEAWLRDHIRSDLTFKNP